MTAAELKIYIGKLDMTAVRAAEAKTSPGIATRIAAAIARSLPRSASEFELLVSVYSTPAAAPFVKWWLATALLRAWEETDDSQAGETWDFDIEWIAEQQTAAASHVGVVLLAPTGFLPESPQEAWQKEQDRRARLLEWIYSAVRVVRRRALARAERFLARMAARELATVASR